MYPLQLTPRITEAIWGGDALVTQYGKTGDPAAKLGESWECWAENPVADGPDAGRTLNEMLRRMGPALVGVVPLADPSSFPILTKIIDARESLSVQVHPDDAYARRVEGEPNGKTECWVILEAQPDAEIILGFTKATTPEEYRKRVADGTLGEILRHVPVKKGDVYHIPAGTLHAIGAGIVIFETQQTSATTYRIFDWNRLDANGKGRELHVDKAADVLDFSLSTREAVVPLSYVFQGLKRKLLVADARFGVEEIALDSRGRWQTEAAANVFFAHETAITVRYQQNTVSIKPWQSLLVPAGIDHVELQSDSATTLYAVTPPGANERARRRLELIDLDPAQIDAFLSQF